MKDEELWYRHSAMNEKANEGLVFFDLSAAADSTIIHHSFFIRAFVVTIPARLSGGFFDHQDHLFRGGLGYTLRR